MRRVIHMALAAALTGAISLAAAPSAMAADRAPACGQPDQPPCQRDKPRKKSSGNQRSNQPQGQAPRAQQRPQQQQQRQQRQDRAQRQQQREQQKRLQRQQREQEQQQRQQQRARQQQEQQQREQARQRQKRQQHEQEQLQRQQERAKKHGAPPPPVPGSRPQYEQQPPPANRKPPSGRAQSPGARVPPPVMHQPYFRDDRRHWSKGDRLPSRYRDRRYAIDNWRTYNLPRPPRGYSWYCQRGGTCLLVAPNNGRVQRVWSRHDRERYWRHRYNRLYVYDDDYYYRNCRRHTDPAGVILGGLIGGLLGSTVSDGNDPGAVFAGIILGAGAGALLTSDMDCNDRSYAYRTYYDGLNRGVPGRYYWSNPRNRHHGEFIVTDYYDDPDGFYCARYRHTTWRGGRPVNGNACRQPNGSWVFLR